MKHVCESFTPLLLGATALFVSLAPPSQAQTKAPETIGGGTVASPAAGPPPSYGIGGPGMVLVKNWHFGTGGTIRNQADMNAEFQYHDQFGTFCNGFGNYGADTVAPDQADAINNQPVEGKDSPPVRQFTADSLKTFLTPLDGATLMDPNKHNTGCGSFVAKWKIPRGGLLLGRDLVWETRVRYKTPPYYWFGIWTCGNKWLWNGRAQGAEMDVIESFGYDNGGGGTNFDGRYWHSSAVAYPYKDTVFYADWTKTMAQQGIRSYDASQYHVWTWVYKRDNSYAMFVDGIKVQAGSNYYWTFGNTAKDEPVDVDFLFDGGWGHTQVQSVDHTLPASAFDGKFYEWNYSRVYLSGGAAQQPYHGPHTLPGTVQAEDYDTGGEGVGYHVGAPARRRSPYRADDAGIETCRDIGGGYDVARTGAGAFLSYVVNVPTALDSSSYTVAFRVSSPAGGRFHLEGPDAAGRPVNLSGPVSVPGTGGGQKWTTVTARVTLPAGVQALKLRTDAGQCSFHSLAFAAPASTASAAFVQADTTTQGNWKGVYGADGYDLSCDQSGTPGHPNPKKPGYATENATGGSYVWQAATTDSRALQQAGGAGRIAAQWYGDPGFDVDCPLSDGKSHQIALYALDWDNVNGGRSETVQVLDAGSGAVLDSRTIAVGPAFVSGEYLVWNVKGHVLFHVVKKSGVNATLSGLFFDPIAGTAPAR